MIDWIKGKYYYVRAVVQELLRSLDLRWELFKAWFVTHIW